MKTMYILLIAILTACSSCKEMDICKDESLTLNKVEFTGSQMRTNGFYYGNSSVDSKDIKYYELFIFYKDGIMMLIGDSEFEKMEEYVTTIANSNQKNTKFAWGLFNIADKEISIEHWVAAQCGYPTVLRSGEILNDTTFVLNKMIRRDSQGTTENNINQEFHFRQFDIKPDSTNNFIK